jgi:hypothetical protein
MAQMQNSQSVALQLEKVRDKLPLLYERDDILLTMIQQRGDVERVSSRNMRLPLQIRPGGKAGLANMDDGDLGRGSGTVYDVAQVTPVFFRHAVEITKLVEYASNAPEKAIENAAKREVKNAMAQFRAFLDKVMQTNGNGVLGTISSIASTTFTMAKPPGSVLVYYNQTIQVYDPTLTTNRGSCSISNTAQVLPNEPATATVAIDNNGHNWLPSMRYGMNDLGGDNLLGNSGFEGWQNSTSLYYWGGVSGTNINQAGSGIYAQETSAGSNPAVDTYTQGTYNVRVGDGATAGLGVNSGCIQVDSTRKYTLMFRVASASTSNNFRPGFRFYWDANCTEADRITTASSNARVLAPVNYDGTSNSTGNWQSTNASLTYNNGITCNCNVTGADWQVSTANAWTPTRNFGVVFRVPNAYSVSTTITHSMRVMLLENTAAAGNYVYFDDVVLSQGPVTPDIRTAPVHDSGGSAVYGSLAISQHLNQGATGQFAGTVALVGGTATVTFPTPFASTPVCVANDQSAIATVRVTPSASSLTLTQSSGTDTINWICIGNPN